MAYDVGRIRLDAVLGREKQRPGPITDLVLGMRSTHQGENTDSKSNQDASHASDTDGLAVPLKEFFKRRQKRSAQSVG
ncbi:MAG TPA: hypothetical protein VM097_05050 [Mycobacteriales bacterium]|nr:hypothetical protein [Mycobacteriales bacterium]